MQRLRRTRGIERLDKQASVADLAGGTRPHEPPQLLIERAAALAVVGSTVQGVESRGKHLLMHFGASGAASGEAGAAAGDADDVSADGGGSGAGSGRPGATLRTHMRMTGSWHLYRAGSR